MNRQSCIYEGDVWHRRFDPQHEFRYQIFMLFIDLDELPELFQKYWFWSTRYPNIAWFRRADHVGPRHQPLAETIRQLVELETGTRPAGPIRLLTQLRYFGYVINPICLYYCFDSIGRLEFVVAEVTNTPWGETHCYVLDVREQVGRLAFETGPADNRDHDKSLGNENVIYISPVGKMLHVSPFMDMNFSYVFGIAAPCQELLVQIANWRITGGEQQRCFDATLKLKRKPMNQFNLIRVLFRYPFMTVQIWIAIYWQALRLWTKGAKFHPNPGPQKTSLDQRPQQPLNRSGKQTAESNNDAAAVSVPVYRQDRSPGSRAGSANSEKDLENVTG